MPFLVVRLEGVTGWKYSGILATSKFAALKRVLMNIVVVGSELFLCCVPLTAMGTRDRQCLLLGELTSFRRAMMLRGSPFMRIACRAK